MAEYALYAVFIVETCPLIKHPVADSCAKITPAELILTICPVSRSRQLPETRDSAPPWLYTGLKVSEVVLVEGEPQTLTEHPLAGVKLPVTLSDVRAVTDPPVTEIVPM